MAFDGKISKKQGKAIVILLLSIFMTAVMSFGILSVHHGFGGDFLKRWGTDFLLGCCIAIPAGYILVPLTENLVDRFTE